MSTSGPLLLQLGLGGRCGHKHASLESGRAVGAAVYPPQLRRAILRGAEAQRGLECQSTPPAALAET
eukprot:10341227-Alexandrium_andersonii.AAC.1